MLSKVTIKFTDLLVQVVWFCRSRLTLYSVCSITWVIWHLILPTSFHIRQLKWVSKSFMKSIWMWFNLHNSLSNFIGKPQYMSDRQVILYYTVKPLLNGHPLTNFRRGGPILMLVELVTLPSSLCMYRHTFEFRLLNCGNKEIWKSLRHIKSRSFLLYFWYAIRCNQSKKMMTTCLLSGCYTQVWL